MEQQITAWIIANFPSVIVSLMMFKVYQNLKGWADHIAKMQKDLIKTKIKLGTLCRIHTERHPEDALKIWVDDEEQKIEQ